ncbi:Rap1 GTPase-GDP dissociation stimulator 1-B, partial [Eschrichtius robustus]|nr:Rap1 GTPase-GDP dissociation stimulator 1-B [Eschrichtius robustus]
MHFFDAIKLQLVEAGLVECLLEIVQQKVDSDKEEDIAELKTASDLMVLLLLGAEAAEQLGKNVKLVERLVEWCEAKDHAGVMGESNRLLSALIRHSKSKDVIKTIVQSGGIKHLVTMATSEHVIMQNEALVALALIAALEL